jgi:alpha-D-ribose 1-methylphosphonate 5-triphosphate synthase subunit PhnI
MTDTYIVTKKCYANEHIAVKADSEEEAFTKAKNNEGFSMVSHLEFTEYLPTEVWQIEKLSSENTQAEQYYGTQEH